MGSALSAAPGLSDNLAMATDLPHHMALGPGDNPSTSSVPARDTTLVAGGIYSAGADASLANQELSGKSIGEGNLIGTSIRNNNTNNVVSLDNPNGRCLLSGDSTAPCDMSVTSHVATDALPQQDQIGADEYRFLFSFHGLIDRLKGGKVEEGDHDRIIAAIQDSKDFKNPLLTFQDILPLDRIRDLVPSDAVEEFRNLLMSHFRANPDLVSYVPFADPAPFVWTPRSTDPARTQNTSCLIGPASSSAAGMGEPDQMRNLAVTSAQANAPGRSYSAGGKAVTRASGARPAGWASVHCPYGHLGLLWVSERAAVPLTLPCPGRAGGTGTARGRRAVCRARERSRVWHSSGPPIATGC